MIKKLIVCFVLTVFILAFPIRILGLGENMQAALKIAKGLVFITIIFFLMHREGFWKCQILLKKMATKRWINMLPVFLIIAAYLTYFWNTDMKNYDGSIGFMLLTLTGTLIAASAEEVIFRGYIFNLFKKYNYSVFKSLVLSSVFFSLIHMVNIFRFEDAWAIFNQLIFAFALGMLFGSIFALTNNLLFVCILHFLINIPSSIKSISENSLNDLAIAESTFFENIMSTVFFIVMMLPALMLSFYYIKIVNEKNGAISENNRFFSVKKAN